MNLSLQGWKSVGSTPGILVWWNRRDQLWCHIICCPGPEPTVRKLNPTLTDEISDFWRDPSRPGTKVSDLGQHLGFSLCHGKGSSKVIIRRLPVTYGDYEYYEDKLNVTGYVKRNC